MQDGWVNEVLSFWFEELTSDDWFSGAPEVDAKIRDRFQALHEELAASVPDVAYRDAQAALAAVLVFDQFPRNIFRKTAKAFATDPLALDVAANALERNLDSDIEIGARSFLYMPFMHSERLADQDRCVELFGTLDREEGLKYAREHRDIVARFGRFPHRNRALGRESSDAELAFMGEHKGYGQ